MQITKNDETIAIPSMSSEEIQTIEFLFQQSAEVIKEMQSKELDTKAKKEILQIALDKEGGIEIGIEKLTQIYVLIEQFQLIQSSSVELLKKKLSRISKKLIEKDETKRKDLENEILQSNSIEISNLNEDEIGTLEEWTGLCCEEIVFDSNKDDWRQTETLKTRIWDRSHLIFLIEDKEGQKFGGYINAKIDRCHNGSGDAWQQQNLVSDPNAFVFSLKSNGRLPHPMKFDIIDQSTAFLLNLTGEGWLFIFGRNYQSPLKWCDIAIDKQNKTTSYCKNNNFQYGNNQNALRGTDANFIPKRILVIQMN